MGYSPSTQSLAHFPSLLSMSQHQNKSAVKLTHQMGPSWCQTKPAAAWVCCCATCCACSGLGRLAVAEDGQRR
eukprot:6977156-Prorocentrum_lima.AAC.1